MICEYCGEQFNKRRGTRFCSKSCHDKWTFRFNPYRRKQIKDSYNRHHPKWIPLILSCAICGKPFSQKTFNQKCCSPACSAASRRLDSKRFYRLHYFPYKKPPLSKTCEFCGNSFKPRHYNSRFCSRVCCLAWRRHESPPDKPPISNQPSLSDLVKQATLCNLDYGNYRALLNTGLTFEQILAQADRRNPAVHNQIGRTRNDGHLIAHHL